MIFVATGSLMVALYFLFRTVYEAVTTPKLVPSRRSKGPLVSIIVPVRNEMGRILDKNIRSILNQDYDDIELIVVDDHSSDGSFECVDTLLLACRFPYSHVRARSRPDGWIGKTWALSEGKRVAKGEWLLFLDADVVFQPNHVSTLVDSALLQKLDGISGLSKLWLGSFWERAILPSLFWLSLMRVPPSEANNPNSPLCFGFGHTIFVRRIAHDEIGGFDAYRSDVLDDCSVMERLKSIGLRVRIFDLQDFASGQMYANLSEIFFGFSKNSFASIGYSIRKLSEYYFFQTLCNLIPALWLFFALQNRSIGLTEIIFLLVILIFLVIHFVMIWKMKEMPLLCVYFPFGHMMACCIMAYSAYCYFARRGVLWKGRPVS